MHIAAVDRKFLSICYYLSKRFFSPKEFPPPLWIAKYNFNNTMQIIPNSQRDRE